MTELTLQVRLKADGSGLVGEVRATGKEVEALTKGLNKTGAEAHRSGREIDRFHRETVRAGESANRTTTLVRGLGAAFVSMGLLQVARGVVSVNVEYDRLSASLKTVTGSQQAANREFAWLQKFAATTPYQLTEVVQAFVKLKSLGLDPTEATLRSFGNTAGAMGKSLNDFIEAVADAVTGEFERLKEFGIKTKQEGDEVRFTFQGIETTVQKSAANIEQYLLRLGNTTFATGMADQATTLGGVFSNLQDSVARAARAIGESGLNTLLKDLARATSDFANAMAEVIEKDGSFIDALRRGFSESQRDSMTETRTKLSTRSLEIDRRSLDIDVETKRLRDYWFGQKGFTSEAELSPSTRWDFEELRIEREKLAAERAQIERRMKDVNLFFNGRSQVGLDATGTTGGSGSATPPPAGPDEKTLQLGEKLIEQLERQKALHGDTSLAAEMRYEIEHGGLTALDEPMKARLVALAQENDRLEATATLEEKRAAERKKNAEEAKRQAEQAAKLAERERERHVKDMTIRVEGLRQATLTEVELEAERHRDAIALLDRAHAEKIEMVASYQALRTRLEQQHHANLQEIAERANADARREAEEQARRHAELMQRPFENALTGIQNSFTSFFERVLTGGVNSFKDLARSVKDIFVRMIAELATLRLFQGSGLLGALGFPAMAGAPGVGGGVAGGIGGLGSLGAPGGGLFGSGFSLSNALSMFSTPSLGIYATDLAAKLGFGGTGQMIAGNIGANFGYGLLGAGAANLLGLGGGTGGSIGGTIGGLAGSFFGPVGGAVGGFLGSAFGGLFGGGIARQTGGATVNSATGVLTSSGAKKSTPDAAIALGQQLQGILREFASITGAKLPANLLAVRTVANADKVGESPYSLFKGGYGVGTPLNYGTSEQLLQQGALALLRDPRFVSAVPKEYQQALGSAGSAQALLQQAQQIKAQKEATDAQKSQAQALLDSLTVTTQWRAQVDGLVRQFADLRSNAATLGLSLAQINQAETMSLRGLRDDQVSTLRGVVDRGRNALAIPALEAFRDELSFGGLSNTTPREQFARARASFEELAAAARAGDVDAIGRFAPAAQGLLQLGRQTFASGSEYQDVFRTVNQTLDQVLTKQRSLEQSLLSDITITLKETSADLIAAYHKDAKGIMDAIRALDERLRKVAA